MAPSSPSAIEDMADVLQTTTMALEQMQRLRRLRDSPSPATRDAANGGLRASRLATLTIDQPMEYPEKPALVAFGFHTDRKLRALVERFQGRRDLAARTVVTWTLVFVALSVGTALAAAFGLWAVATLLLLVRIVAGLRTVGLSAFPAETTSVSERSAPTALACFTGHVNDVIVLFGAASYLVLEGEAGWALFAFGAIVTLLLATLFRVAVLQLGVRLDRLVIERFFRLGTLVPGLALAAVLPLSSAGTGAVIGLAISGVFTHAIIEVARTIEILRRLDIAGRPRSVLMVSDDQIILRTAPVPAPSISSTPPGDGTSHPSEEDGPAEVGRRRQAS
jgi:hypothetical protein